MTKQEAVIISAYTGYLCAVNFSDVHKYIEKIMGRPVWTHEIPELYNEIRDKSKADFVALKVEDK